MEVPATDRHVSFVRRLRSRRAAWVWLIGLAFACGVVLFVDAFTVHDRCISSDPACAFHSYTLLHTAGPAVLAFVGAPAVLSLIVATLLRIKVARRSARAGEVAWFLALVTGITCLIGLLVDGFLMLLAAVLVVGAVAAAPLPEDPNDPLHRSRGAS